jgi:circadian clock protein KaiB
MKHPMKHQFRLYVAGGTQNSVDAANNLAFYCKQNLPASHEIELIDVLTRPELALADKVFMTPTLVRMRPRPHLRIVGTLSNAQSMSTMLDLAGAVA